MIACGLRPGEALNLKWVNIDLDRRTLTLKPDQTKSFRKHVAPLSDLAMRAIKQQLSVRRSDYVFPASRRGRDGSMNHAFSESAFGEATKRAGLNLQTTPHAWRAVFRSWCKVHGRVPFEIAEEALAHATAPVVGAYDRDPAIEERRDVMARYAAWLTAETNVVALRKAS
jgi:integrase